MLFKIFLFFIFTLFRHGALKRGDQLLSVNGVVMFFYVCFYFPYTYSILYTWKKPFGEGGEQRRISEREFSVFRSLKPIFHLASLFARREAKTTIRQCDWLKLAGEKIRRKQVGTVPTFLSVRANKVAKWKIGFSTVTDVQLDDYYFLICTPSTPFRLKLFLFCLILLLALSRNHRPCILQRKNDFNSLNTRSFSYCYYSYYYLTIIYILISTEQREYQMQDKPGVLLQNIFPHRLC